MNQLITVEQVRARLSLPDDEGINAVISSAIGAALPKLRAVLDTAFDAGESTDLFFINPNVYAPQNSLYTLRLRNGLIKTDSVLFASADSLEELQSAALVLAPTVILYDKGFVKVSSAHECKFVKVYYEHGLAEHEETPDWLVEGMLAYVAQVMASTQVGEEKPVMTTLHGFLIKHGMSILSSKVRSVNGSILAMN